MTDCCWKSAAIFSVLSRPQDFHTDWSTPCVIIHLSRDHSRRGSFRSRLRKLPKLQFFTLNYNRIMPRPSTSPHKSSNSRNPKTKCHSTCPFTISNHICFSNNKLRIWLRRLETDEIQRRVQRENLLSTLTTRPTDFHARMDKYVYPTIEGTQHESLIHYYTLLDGCDSGQEHGDHVSPSAHVKLLRKIKTVASGECWFRV